MTDAEVNNDNELVGWMYGTNEVPGGLTARIWND